MANTTIKPLGARVLVEVVEAEQVTASGLIIPDSAKEKPQRATVIAVGNGTEGEKMEVKEGDVVLYGKYAGTEVEDQNHTYLILNQTDILAIV
jgi:chaperonin GroES